MSTMNNNTIDIVLQNSDKEDIVLTDTVDNVEAKELAEACTKADTATIWVEDSNDVVAKNECHARLQQFKDLTRMVSDATDEPKLVFKGSIRFMNGEGKRKDGSTFQWSMVKLYKGLSSSNNSQTMMDKLQSLIV